jgi:hypothetical protein
MCQDFSCLVQRDYQVFWKMGVSSHDRLETLFSPKEFVKVEIVPYDYLYLEKGYNFIIDEESVPDWFSDEHKTEAIKAYRIWKKELVKLVNFEEARNPINPLPRKRKPTKQDIELWTSAWTLMGDSAGACVWDLIEMSIGEGMRISVTSSVWGLAGNSVQALLENSVGDWARSLAAFSVGAYIGSLFNIWDGRYKFQPVVDLWKRGFVPSFDGTTWRLHSGKKAEIVYEMKAKVEEEES